MLKERKFDIIHSHFGHNAKVVLNLKVFGIIDSKTKFVTTFHGYDLIPGKASFYKKAYASIFKESNCFTVNTPYLKAQLLSLNPSIEPIEILPVGLNTQFFKRQEVKHDTNHFDIVFCGRLIPLKGLDFALDIVKALVDKNFNHVRFNIIGEGPMKKAIQDKIALLNLDHYVFLKGALNQEQIKEVFEQSDVFLLSGIADPDTGQQEAQGLVIQEAQAMGLPVVISDAGGMKYGMIPNETGFVVPICDLDGFVNALESLITNSNLRQQMSCKAREYIENNYDNRILFKKLNLIYHQILEN